MALNSPSIPYDPRNHPQGASQPGQGGNKRYIGTGQDRQSVSDFTPEQVDIIRQLLTRQSMEFNNSLNGGSPMPNWVQPEDVDSMVEGTQPQPVADPWSMTQGWQEAGGRGPAGFGNYESDAYGDNSWMARLLGHQFAQPNQIRGSLMNTMAQGGGGSPARPGVAQGPPQGQQAPQAQMAQRQALTRGAMRAV